MREICVLAFDFGLRHIGLAVGQSVTRTANRLTTLRANAGIPVWPALDDVVVEWQPDLMIVGLPLNMDDSESAMSERARQFAERLRKRYDARVELVDERLSSFEAKQIDPDDDHAVAAQLIAETWLTPAAVAISANEPSPLFR